MTLSDALEPALAPASTRSGPSERLDDAGWRPPDPPATRPPEPASTDRDGQVTYSIAEVAELMGVSPHTLRYYERVGLLEVERDSGGRRAYRAADVGRVKFITCLRSTSLPIRQLQQYFDMVDAGSDTQSERLALLQDHRTNVLAQIADMHDALATIEFKIEMYGGTHVPA
jgi:DNA-binding transcriptional MerR regulator